MCTCNKKHLARNLFVYVRNSCGVVQAVKKKYCQISRTQEQIKPVKENLFVLHTRKHELVKKFVKENSSVRGLIERILIHY